MKTKLRQTLLLSIVALGLGMTACKKEGDPPGEKLGENIKDGLNVRENEELKDAGENAADAVEDAGEAVKDKAEDVAN